MKIKLLIISIVIALCLSATPALAALLTTQIKVTDGPGSGSGGAFWAEVVTGSISYDNVYIPQGASFLTFCVENNESLSFGVSYWIDIEDRARLGGSGGNEGPPGDTYDLLDPITAALYQKWLDTENTTDAATADKYQLAIWKQEDEAVWNSSTSEWYKGDNTTLLDSAYQAYTETAIDNLIGTVNSPSGIGNVRVMTLWENQDKTGYQQDLVVVPAPAAVLLGILGLGVAGWKLRKYA